MSRVGRCCLWSLENSSSNREISNEFSLEIWNPSSYQAPFSTEEKNTWYVVYDKHLELKFVGILEVYSCGTWLLNLAQSANCENRAWHTSDPPGNVQGETRGRRDRRRERREHSGGPEAWRPGNRRNRGEKDTEIRILQRVRELAS